MRPITLLPLLVCCIATSLGCGSGKSVRREPSFTEAPVSAHHDYTSTWVYAVGEVESPSESDCKKALTLVEAEASCVGAACKFGSNLVRDFEFACRKSATVQQRTRIAELRAALAPRTAKAPSDCARQVDEWLERGCGKDGACEPKLQQWAAHCSEELKSPLALHLLERLVENSLREPRRVKFDVRSCGEYKKKLEDAAQCSKPFDCEDALPQIDEYLERCAEGARKAVPLAQATQIVRIRLGAEKPIEPIALTDSMSRLTTIADPLALADGTGVITKVCGESVTNLTSYLDQRTKCQAGEVTLLRAVDGEGGSNLELQKLWHESDASFARAYPKLLVVGEADVREQRLIDDFATGLANLPQQAALDFATAFERVNQAYAMVPTAMRQSEKLYQALTPHDAALVTMFSLIGEQKARLSSRRLTDGELLGLMRRTDKLMFSDMTKKGAIDIGKSCELSELTLEQALPLSFAAYRQKLTKLKQLFDKRNITANEDPAAVRQTLMTYTQGCSATRLQVAAAQKELARCFAAAEACSVEERSKIAANLEAARSDWRAARIQEIVAKVAMGQREAPSAVCNSW